MPAARIYRRKKTCFLCRLLSTVFDLADRSTGPSNTPAIQSRFAHLHLSHLRLRRWWAATDALPASETPEGVMRASRIWTSFYLLSIVLSCFLSAYGQITPSQDAFTNSASPGTNYGANALLDVNGTKQVSYIQFDLTPIPSASSVSKATLKLYVNAVTK